MIPIQFALRRRMMILQASASGAFAFEYTGDYTDNRDENGIGTVRFTSSGTLTVTGKAVTVTATTVGGGGGACGMYGFMYQGGTGGGGGVQTFELTLEQGFYEIVIGTGGAAAQNVGDESAGSGGSTTAFGKTSTGGTGGWEGPNSANDFRAGTGGSPNGGNGTVWIGSSTTTMSGGSPNGGGCVNGIPQAGGDGYVELIFS